MNLAEHTFFLKRHVPHPSTLQFLRKLYPTIDWSRVSFYEGLPWFTRFTAPYVTAQALPDFYSCGKYRIYLKKFDESRAQCIADMAHEGFHVLQAMHFFKGYGIGFLRGFMVYYLALFARQGYRMNSLEVPAYDQEYRVLDFCMKHGIHGISPALAAGTLETISPDREMIFKEAPLRDKPRMYLLVASFFVSFFIALIRPIADLFVFLLFFLPAGRIKTKSQRREPGSLRPTDL